MILSLWQSTAARHSLWLSLRIHSEYALFFSFRRAAFILLAEVIRRLLRLDQVFISLHFCRQAGNGGAAAGTGLQVSEIPQHVIVYTAALGLEITHPAQLRNLRDAPKAAQAIE